MGCGASKNSAAVAESPITAGAADSEDARRRKEGERSKRRDAAGASHDAASTAMDTVVASTVVAGAATVVTGLVNVRGKLQTSRALLKPSTLTLVNMPSHFFPIFARMWKRRGIERRLRLSRARPTLLVV